MLLKFMTDGGKQSHTLMTNREIFKKN